jgi:RNA polymerase sigma-70 factor, ECF subfamily
MSPRQEQEQAIREAFDAGDMERAATRTLGAYGREIFGFLAARVPTHSDADEIFSMFTENLWAGLPKFGWRCSMRTWCYVLAHNARYQYTTAPHRRAGRNVALSCPGVLSQLADDFRTTTRPYLQTEVKDGFRKLRDQLDEEEQLLLLLRVDRKLSFREIAITVLGDADCEAAVLAREEARLRQAFARMRSNFRRLAENAGLLEPKA